MKGKKMTREEGEAEEGGERMEGERKGEGERIHLPLTLFSVLSTPSCLASLTWPRRRHLSLSYLQVSIFKATCYIHTRREFLYYFFPVSSRSVCHLRTVLFSLSVSLLFPLSPSLPFPVSPSSPLPLSLPFRTAQISRHLLFPAKNKAREKCRSGR